MCRSYYQRTPIGLAAPAPGAVSETPALALRLIRNSPGLATAGRGINRGRCACCYTIVPASARAKPPLFTRATPPAPGTAMVLSVASPQGLRWSVGERARHLGSAALAWVRGAAARGPHP